MIDHAKPIIALASGMALLSGLLGQTAQAGPTTILTGTALLADAQGSIALPEALIVSYTVTFDSGLYTYTYDVANPAGDVILTGHSAGQAEEFNTFSVGFNTTLPNAIVGAPTGPAGTYIPPPAATGITWDLDNFYAGTSSGAMSFTSALPPVPGDASAQDANPPSPWSSFPPGQEVPVPGAVPDSTNTLILLAGMVLLLPFRSILEKKACLAL